MMTENGGLKAEVSSLERRVINLDVIDSSISWDTGFSPEVEPEHAGFNDAVYQERRRQIADKAINYRIGDKIPVVDYTDNEKKTWKTVLEACMKLYPDYMCEQFNENFVDLLHSGLYTADDIPQLQDVSTYLQEKTGFRLRPVGGFVSPRCFLSCLAFRVFPCTQFVRHHANPLHSVEPDVIHELLGHVTMFADQSFAAFSQSIGQAALVASNDVIDKLATLYWFTIEFGLCRKEGKVSAYGAALASSFGELKYAVERSQFHAPFDIGAITKTSTDKKTYQDKYFVCESFGDMQKKIREYCSRLMSGTVCFNQVEDNMEIILKKTSNLTA